MLKIQNLQVKIDNKPILKGLSLILKSNETHILMGPNGCGKSTLANTLAGHPYCQITAGKIFYKGKDITKLSAERRAGLGIFLAFQNPTEIPGVSLFSYLNQISQISRPQKADSLSKSREKLKEIIKILKLKKDFLNRNLNEGFSGGEKKKSEILQMLLLKPSLMILDEIDSGLDVDSFKDILEIIQRKRIKDSALLIITHNPGILKFIKPAWAHIMKNSRIIETGGREVIKRIEKRGFR